jgi:glycosyltransferase involved in cell wall biosynthesis
MKKVSVIIPTYNRFDCLLRTMQSVKEQSYENIEIIVVNDRSTQKEYYEYDWTGVKIIHLEKNSKEKFGYACPGGYQRNFGMKIAEGDYIAFCDDDDIWFPTKIELQIKAMNETGCKMSCTDGLIGWGVYNENKVYSKYNAEYQYNVIKDIYQRKGSSLLDNGFPKIWNLDFLQIHNCAVCSSIIIDKDIVNKVGDFIIQGCSDDYQYWLRALQHTNIIYLNDVCFYYDAHHGGGKNYQD